MCSSPCFDTNNCLTMFVREVAFMSSRVSEEPIIHLKANTVERVLLKFDMYLCGV